MVQVGAAGLLSLGFIPQTSLSAEDARRSSAAAGPAVSGVHTPDFVERRVAGILPLHVRPVSGVHTPDFVERVTDGNVVDYDAVCLWGSYPRLR